MSQSFAAQYRAAERLAGGRDPIEAGLLGRLADHECRHGRLAYDTSAPCGCWPEEGAAIYSLPSSPPAADARACRRLIAR